MSNNSSNYGTIGGLIASIYNIFNNERNRLKMAKSEKERMDYEDAINDENAAEAYERQRQFQEDYLTPEAQIKSTLAGYTAAGINKMALAGTSPGASSSSVPQSSGTSGAAAAAGVPDAMGPLLDALGLKLKQEQINKQYEVDKINADANKLTAEANAEFARSRTAGQNIQNQWLDDIFGAEVNNKNADTSLKEQQKMNLQAAFQSEQLHQDLTMRHIQIADQDLAIKEYQAAIQKAIADNADEYYHALAKIQTAQSILASGQAGIFTKTMQKQLRAAIAQLNGVIIETGMNAKIFNGEAFTKQTEGKMTDAEKTQMWVDVGKGVLNVAVGAGLGYMVGGRSAIPPTNNIIMPKPGYFDLNDLSRLTGGNSIRP